MCENTYFLIFQVKIIYKCLVCNGGHIKFEEILLFCLSMGNMHSKNEKDPAHRFQTGYIGYCPGYIGVASLSQRSATKHFGTR